MIVIWFYINWKEENYLSDRGYWQLVGIVKIKSEQVHNEEEPEIQVLVVVMVIIVMISLQCWLVPSVNWVHANLFILHNFPSESMK